MINKILEKKLNKQSFRNGKNRKQKSETLTQKIEKPVARCII